MEIIELKVKKLHGYQKNCSLIGINESCLQKVQNCFLNFPRNVVNITSDQLNLRFNFLAHVHYTNRHSMCGANFFSSTLSINYISLLSYSISRHINNPMPHTKHSPVESILRESSASIGTH